MEGEGFSTREDRCSRGFEANSLRVDGIAMLPDRGLGCVGARAQMVEVFFLVERKEKGDNRSGPVRHWQVLER